jgi:hypothetical protein
MVGMNAPAAAAVQLIHQTAPVQQQTSTQKIRTALDNVMGISVRERELEDKADYGDTPLTADEQAELTQLCSAREARRAS